MHVHHEGPVIEFLTDPISVRRKYIREDKPEHERKLRLRALKEVKSPLPKRLVAAWERYCRASKPYERALKAYHGGAYVPEARERAWEAHGRAWETYARALKAAHPALQKIHKKECALGPDCPGYLVFPKGGAA